MNTEVVIDSVMCENKYRYQVKYLRIAVKASLVFAYIYKYVYQIHSTYDYYC